MPSVDLFLFGFIILVVGIGVGWFIYDSRSEDEK